MQRLCQWSEIRASERAISSGDYVRDFLRPLGVHRSAHAYSHTFVLPLVAGTGLGDVFRTFSMPSEFHRVSVDLLPLTREGAIAVVRRVILERYRVELDNSWDGPELSNVLADFMDLPRTVEYFADELGAQLQLTSSDRDSGQSNCAAYSCTVLTAACEEVLRKRISAVGTFVVPGVGLQCTLFLARLSLLGLRVSQNLVVVDKMELLDVSRTGAFLLDLSNAPPGECVVRLPRASLSTLKNAASDLRSSELLLAFPKLRWTWQDFERVQSERLALVANAFAGMQMKSTVSMSELFPGAVMCKALSSVRLCCQRVTLATEAKRWLVKLDDTCNTSDLVKLDRASGNGTASVRDANTVLLTAPNTALFDLRAHFFVAGPASLATRDSEQVGFTTMKHGNRPRKRRPRPQSPLIQSNLP
jgi:hypothetical protein